MPDEPLFHEDEDLRGQRFAEVDLTEAEFLDCDLTAASFVGCTGNGANFTGSDLADVTFESCTLVDATFVRVGVAGTAWRGCKLLSSTFQQLTGLGWEIRDTSCMYGDMRGLSFEGKTLRGVDLSEASLIGGCFDRAVFEECRLRGANWTNATFAGADLRGADLGPIEDAASIVALRGAIISEAQARHIVGALGLQVIDGDA